MLKKLILAGAVALSGLLTAENPDAVSLKSVQEKLAAAVRQRPRLFADAGTLAGLPRAAADGAGLKMAGRIIHDATLMLDYPVLERKQIGRRLLDVSRNVLFRVNTLCVAFYLTGDGRFARRCIDEIVAASKFSDWNPPHFLDTAEMMLAVATGYDWLYDRMSEEERAVVRTALIEKGLKPSAAVTGQWATSYSNNWNQVCHAGSVAAALAVAEEAPETAAPIILRALQNVPRAMRASYAPGGAYPEGPTYWSYGTEFNVVMLALLEHAFGTDFGLSESPGFSRTGDFITAAFAPSMLPFSYGDSWMGYEPEMAKFYLIKRFGKPEWFFPQEQRILDKYADGRPADVSRGGSRLYPLSLLFLTEIPETMPEGMPLSYFSGNEAAVPVCVFRSGWDARAVYLGVKAGSPNCSHGHMDIGSFLLEADGVRWAVDLGMENYARLEARNVRLSDGGQEGQRWEVFRVGPQSHNILMIDDRRQSIQGKALITRFDPEEKVAEVDLTSVYPGQAQKIVRTFRLLPTHEVVVSDAMTGLTPGASVRWQMCTKAKVAGASTNVLRLSAGGREMVLTASPDITDWETVDCRTLMKEYDSPNPNTVMIRFSKRVPENGELNFEVRFSSGNIGKQ